MKQRKNNTIKLRKSWLIYLLLCTVALTGVTLSLYMAKDTATDSARVAKMNNITLTEKGTFYKNGKLMIVPGENLEKVATVRFDGSEMAMVVLITVDAQGWNTTDNRNFNAANGKIHWSVDEAWTFSEAEGSTYTYAIWLKPNENLEKNIIKDDKVYIESTLRNSEMKSLNLSIAFTAKAMQSEGKEAQR